MSAYRRRQQLHREACNLYGYVQNYFENERAAERERAEAAECLRQENERKEREARDDWLEMHRGLALEALDGLSGHAFERELQRMFRQLGFEVEITKGSGDQGADLLLKQQGRRIAVQAKRYAGNVGNAAVQEILGAMAYYQCQHGIVVTTADFSRSARELAARALRVELWDRAKLHQAYEHAFPVDPPPFSWERYNELKSSRGSLEPLAEFDIFA